MEALETRAGELRELVKEAVRRSVFPLVVIGPLLVVGWRVSGELPLGGLTLGIQAAVAGVLILCEYVLAFDKDWGSTVKGNRTDFIYVVLAASMDKATFVLCASAVATFGAYLAETLGVTLWPSHWHVGLQVVVALLVADVATYFRHRLFHKSAFLWRFHRIHHSMTGLYWIRSAYTHPLEQLCILLAIMLPVSLLGAGEAILGVVAFAYGLSGLIQHANIDSHSSFLNFVFATPEIHRIHHTANERGNRSNFSAFFVFNDLLFGSYCRPQRDPAPMRVGLEGVTSFPGDFLTHLGMPFQRDPPGVQLEEGWRRGEVVEANEH